MGSCCTHNSFESQYIDSKMIENQKIEQSYKKILFLGPGGSGKSTIFTQLQWLHGDALGEYQESDIHYLVSVMQARIIYQMQDAIKHYLTEAVSDEALQNAIETVRVYNVPEYGRPLTPLIADAIQHIWTNDKRIKQIFKEYHVRKILDESTEYFWNNLDRMRADDFKPNKTDIINMRNRTTGIIERKFTISQINLHIFDVGGQKSERRKWISCFGEVCAVVFVVDISSYNEMMFEDTSTNKMVDALQLFENTIHHKMFTDTPITLFLNKKDLFADKIKTVPLTVCPAFVDYDDHEDKDANDYQQTAQFIKDKFDEINAIHPTSRKIYMHLTCAMDDENVNSVFNDIVKVVIGNTERIVSKIALL